MCDLWVVGGLKTRIFLGDVVLESCDGIVAGGRGRGIR